MQNLCVRNVGIRYALWLWLSCCTLLLAACGGGAVVESTPPPPPVVADPTLTLTLVNALGQQTTQLATGSTARLVATVRDGTGALVPDAEVSFTTVQTITSFSPASGLATTGNTNSANMQRGVASISMLVGSSPGTDTVTAKVTVDGITVSQSLSYGVTAPTLALALTNASGQATNSISSNSPGTLTATVLDGNSQPVSGAVVSFSNNGEYASFDPASGTALVNSGVATIGLVAGSKLGADTVTATVTVGGVSVSQSLSYAVQPGSTPQSSLVLSLSNSDGLPSNTITPGRDGTAMAVVRDSVGNPVANAVVTFSTDDQYAKLVPAAGTALTDSTGMASIGLSALGAGASTLTATVTVAGKTLSQSLSYRVGSSTLVLQGLQFGLSSVPAGSSTTVSVNLVDTATGQGYATPVDVDFHSSCVQQGKATLTTPVPTVVKVLGNVRSAIATSTYTNLSCTGQDVVTASVSIGGQLLSSSGAISLPVNAGSSLQFISATPQTISLRGLGGAEQSTVVFQVNDANGKAAANQDVNFVLNTTVGGLSLSPATARSDSAGRVSTVVKSGNVSAVVWVTASLAAQPSIRSQSLLLTVSTGLPHQKGMSLAASVLNPEFYQRDGETVDLTATLADRYGNAVPDGTAVLFLAEGGVGVISPAQCTTSQGRCTVTLTSGGKRSALGTVPLAGRQTIMAYALGEESFSDNNGDGRFGLGDTLVSDLGELYIDANENGAYDLGETYIDLNHNGVRDASNGLFDGPGCDASCGNSITQVLAKEVIVWSGSDIVFTPSQSRIAFPYYDYGALTSYTQSKSYYSGNTRNLILDPNSPYQENFNIPPIKPRTDDYYNRSVPAGTDPRPSLPVACTDGQVAKITLKLTDQNGNVPPAGTEISISTSNGKLETESSWVVPSSNAGASGFVIPVTVSSDAYATKYVFSTELDGECNNDSNFGLLTVTAKAPKSGKVSTFSMPVID